MNVRLNPLLQALVLSALVAAPAFAAANDGNRANNARVSVSNMYVVGTTPAFSVPILGGSSTLWRTWRTNGAVSLAIQGAGLTPGDVYTVWWAIFNHPEFCTAPGCAPKDFPQNGGDPGVQASLGWATGRVADEFGQASFAAHLVSGEGFPGQVLFGPGLLNARGAEIHAVVRSHGPAAALTSAQLEAALTTELGGCAPNNGPNTCANKQVARHDGFNSTP